MSRDSSRCALPALLVFALCATSFAIAHAQSITATLSGTVVDQNGAAVPGAEVKIINPATGFSRQATSNDSGSYAFPLLPPGAYSVTVQRDGFAPVRVENLVLNVGDQKALQVQLKTGDLNATVTIDSTAETVRTDAAVSTVVNRQFVEKIPLNGRSFQSLILLTPGVITNSPQSASNVGGSGEFSVNGQRLESNRFMVDGVSANNGIYIYGYSTAASGGGLPTGTAMGTTQSLVPLDALQEFRASTSSYSAEFGSSPGGQFSFVTRSGTNGFHGSAFEYLRNDALDANDWFNNSFGRAKPEQRQNDFGGTIGGPVTIPHLYNGRDRTFFFFSYEGLRLQQPKPATLAYVPTVALRQQVPAVLKPVLDAFPLPNGANLANGLAEYLYTDSVPSELDSTSIRVDHNIGSKQRLFFRYSNTPSKATTRLNTLYSTTRFRPRTYSFGLTGMISQRLTNELRVGYSPTEGGSFYSYLAKDGATPVDLFKLQGIDLNQTPSSYFYVEFDFPGYSPYTGINTVKSPQRQLNLNDVVNFATGKHQLKAGMDYLRTSSDLQRTDPYVYIAFDSASNLIANQAYEAFVGRFAPTHPVYQSFGAFAQDDWRISPRLNLSLGLRWEVGPPPGVSKGTLPRVLSGSVAQPSTLAVAPVGTPIWKTAYNNFAPRLGLSYVVRDAPDYQTVLRTGFGVFYDNNQNFRIAAFDSNPGSLYSRFYSTNVSFPLTPQQLNITDTSLTPPYGTFNLIGDASNPLKMPYTLQWNVSVEQALQAGQSLTLSYVGARGHRMLETDALNLAALNPSFRTVLLTRNQLTSSYDALQAQFQRRLSRGVQAMVSYTWSHSIDFGSTNASLPVKRGSSDYDLRHNLSAAVTYEIPGISRQAFAKALLNRWSLDGRFTARSGFPVSLSGNRLTDPATGNAYFGGLDIVPGVPFYVNDPSLPGGRRINPAAFKLPVGSQVGTAPRNFMRGFGATQVDMVLRRDFPLTERFRLQLRLEAFNILNHPNFGVINSSFGNAQFGKATAMLNRSLGGLSALYQQGGPRSLQLGLRLQF